MHAFLLLDEQNLKDIGVSTIGARKKIHHAIQSEPLIVYRRLIEILSELRDSARLQGYGI